LSVYLNAKQKAGLQPPWAYVRAKLAEHWHVLPFVVDELPYDEIRLQLHFWAAEAAAQEPTKGPNTTMGQGG
jgi:hypothetical protein